MDEEKAAAYYDELTRKGEGAARFKQGLGFASSRDTGGDGVPSRGSAVPSSSSFLSSFVRASSSTKAVDYQRQNQTQSIQNKLRKKPSREENQYRDLERRESLMQLHSRRSRSGEKGGYRALSRENDSDRYKSQRRGEGRSERRRSRSKSLTNEDRGKRRDRRRSRSWSPQRERSSDRGRGDVGKVGKEKNGPIDYSRLIHGYEKMSAAQRVKAKMKLQLSEAVKMDAFTGLGPELEYFELDKDSPLVTEVVEAAEDDTLVVKQIHQGFRSSAVEAWEEEKMKVAHDEAMFGTPAPTLSSFKEEAERNEVKNIKVPALNMLSDEVLSMQLGSWRDRARND